MKELELTFDQHATQARAAARAAGFADCMHYAPRAYARADALYALANASGIRWYEGRAIVALLPDGRMVLGCETVTFVEESTAG